MWLKETSFASDHCWFGQMPDDLILRSLCQIFNIEENWKGHHETDHTDLKLAGFGNVSEVTRFAIPAIVYLLWKETGETS